MLPALCLSTLVPRQKCNMIVFDHFITVGSRDSSEAQVYNPKMTSTEFAELAKLCQDQNILGDNLLSMARALLDQLSIHSESVRCKGLLRLAS